MSKIGIMAFSSNSGLGNQTWELYKHLNPAKTLVADLSKFNKMPTHHERFPDARIANGIPTNQDMEWLVNDMDLVIVCETPLNYYLYEYANRVGVKTVQQYNREFLDFWKNKDLAQPTYLGHPAPWEVEKVRGLGLKSKIIPLPVPVNTDLIKPRVITKLETIIHIIGRPSYMDRNGTIPFLELAMNNPQYEYIVYLQPPTDARAIEYFEPVRLKLEEAKTKINIKVIENVDNYEDMYKTGDLFILPRRYGGLCLPMQEALTAGIPVIMPNISPNDETLPEYWLFDALKKGEFFFHAPVDVYEPLIGSMQEVLDRFSHPAFMTEANEETEIFRTAMNWDKLLPLYKSL